MVTKIEWTDETWNPVTGCSKISAGCLNCYAERMASRLAGRYGYPADNPFAVTLHRRRLDVPLCWKKRRRIFVCSMGDLFHPDVSVDFLIEIFDVIRRAIHAGGGLGPNHTFQILTKRPHLLADFMRRLRFDGDHLALDGSGSLFAPLAGPGLQLGTTTENQEQADLRIPELLRSPKGRLFVSVEPMLGPVDLTPYLPYLDWVICGGETGPRYRPMKSIWALDLHRQCMDAGVPFFFKQMAGRKTTPEALQVRELPGQEAMSC